MYLKSIKVAGFKSFADQQIIRFDNPFTCIVGPNGCGKSNIIDAVKWVIGESSAKNLRGSALTDVIFNGSTSRKPLGVAKVELIFDNSKQRLKGQWAAFKEISLSRVLYRDGQSNYYLNQTKCRRKDIIDLFLGTGLGPRSYAIIEQGMVNKFIDAKPMDMRLQVEEASGVSKYKEKRKETLSKLTEARENLDRLTDLRQELERRVKSLEKQSEKALQYQDYKENWAGARQELYSTLWRSAQEDFHQSSKNLKEKKANLESEQKTYQDFQASHARLFLEVEQQEEVVFESNRTTANLKGELKDLQHQWQKNQERKDYLSQDLKEHQQVQKNLLLKIQELENNQQSQEKHQELSQSTLELKQASNQAKENLEASQTQQDKLAQSYQNLLKRRQAPQSQADVLNAQIKNLEQQILKGKQILNKAMPEQKELKEELEHWQEKKTQINLSSLKEQLENIEHNLQERENTSEQLQEKLLELKQSKVLLETQCKALEQKINHSQKQLENIDSKPLDFLEENFPGYRTLFKDIDVKQSYFAPLAEILADTQIVQVSKKPDVEHFKNVLSRKVHLCWGEKSSFHFSHAPVTLPSFMKNYELLETWDDLEQLIKSSALEKQSEKIWILPNGALLSDNWFSPVSQTEKKSRAQITLEKTKAQKEKEEKEQQLLETKKKIQSLQDQSSQLKQVRSDLKIQRQSLGQQFQQTQALEQKAHLKIDYLKKTLDEKKHYYVQVEKETKEDKEKIEQHREQLEEVLALIEAQETSLMQSEMQLNEQKEHLLQARQAQQLAYSAYKAELAKLENLERQNESSRVQTQQILQEKERYSQKEKNLVENLENLAPTLKDLDEQISEISVKIDHSSLIEQEQNEKLEKIKKQHQEVTRRRKSFEKNIAKLKEQIHQDEICWERALVSQNHVKEQILDLGLDFKLLNEIHSEHSKETLKKKVQQLEQDIEKLGPVNLKACKEFEQESARLEELVQQSDDVLQSLKLLSEAVCDLDKEIVQTYQKTLNALKSSFAELFPKLFGGGQAHLREVDIEGQEEKGLVVFAQPPGKKNASLSALSGGEKALTAAALVFAFFKLNPAPFCLMDEIDAPLDDTNTSRLAKMLDYLSQTVQCLCVTHSKIMMEKGHALYGVTMKEPGVSRLVSVDLHKTLSQLKGAKAQEKL